MNENKINGQIYLIKPKIEHDEKHRYYGSTTKDLNLRLSQHKSSYKRYLENKATGKYMVFDIFDLYGIENVIIVSLMSIACDSKKDLELVEGLYIMKNACMNKIKVGRTRKQYILDNKDKIKQRYLDNRETLLKYFKCYGRSKILCDVCNISYCRDTIQKHRKSLKHVNNYLMVDNVI